MTSEHSTTDFGDVLQACPNCGTIETDMDDPVRIELDPDDRSYDDTYTMVFCSDSCHEQWADRKD